MKSEAKQVKVKLKSIKKIKPDVFLLTFSSAHLAKTAKPGNFLQIKINSVILRRPFSIHKIEKNNLYVLFRIRGRGTKALAKIKAGAALDIIGPLGTGFKLDSGVNILLAGGLGVAPLVFLAQKLKTRQGLVLLGAKSKNEVLAEKEFKKLGFKVQVATDDGSQGHKGTVTSLLKNKLTTNNQQLTTIYACGPKEMFSNIAEAIKKYPKVNCQVSFEQFMGCGLGVCSACVIETKKGYQKVCEQGPVFNLRDVF